MFGSLLIAIAAAALCSFLPWTAVTVMSAVFVLGNAYGTSMELALLAAFILLLMALAQSAFRAGNAILIVLVPLLFYLHVPYVLPVIAGSASTCFGAALALLLLSGAVFERFACRRGVSSMTRIFPPFSL